MSEEGTEIKFYILLSTLGWIFPLNYIFFWKFKKLISGQFDGLHGNITYMCVYIYVALYFASLFSHSPFCSSSPTDIPPPP